MLLFYTLLLLWLMAVCNMLSFVYMLEYGYVCMENNDNNYELQMKWEKEKIQFHALNCYLSFFILKCCFFKASLRLLKFLTLKRCFLKVLLRKSLISTRKHSITFPKIESTKKHKFQFSYFFLSSSTIDMNLNLLWENKIRRKKL